MTPYDSTHDGELEQRLRQHYQSVYGASPKPTHVWEQVVQRLGQQTTLDTLDTIELDNRGDKAVRQTAESIEARSHAGTMTHSPRRFTGRLRNVAALAATLLLVATSGAVFGLLATRHVSHATTVGTIAINAKLPGYLDHITGMQMLSDSNGWVVGVKASGTQNQAGVILHFDGHHWNVAESLAHAQLYSISMISPTEGWVSGDFYTGQDGQQDVTRSFLLHYKGGRWLQEATPFKQIFAVKMVSAHLGWAQWTPQAPYPVTGGPTQIAIYHDGAWTMTAYPTDNTIVSASIWFTSPTEGWAASYGTALPVMTIWHYTDGQWSKTATTTPQYAGITAIEMTSVTNGWAIGALDGNPDGGKSLLLYHYDGIAWKQIAVPANVSPDVLPEQKYGRPEAFSVVSPTEFWIMGQTYGIRLSNPHYFMLHYADGIWSGIHMPDSLHPVWDFPPYTISVLSANDVWMYVGQNNGSDWGLPTIAHYHDSQWMLYK